MEYIKYVVAGMLGALAAFWVSIPIAVWYLLLFMGLDYLTGLIAGFANKSLSSDVGLHGLKRKALVLILVGTAHAVTHSLEVGYDLGTAVAIAYCVNEFISIVENCHRAGVWVPGVLLEAMEKGKKLIAYEGPERRNNGKPQLPGG